MADFEGRRERLATLLNELDLFFLTDPTDIFYYTGYRPSGAVYLALGRECTLFATSTENETETTGVEVRYFSRFREVARQLKGRIGYDEGSLLAVHYQLLKKRAKLGPARKLIKQPRGVKDRKEINLIREAIGITKNAFKTDIYGRKESHVARSIEIGFMQNGGGLAFPAIVAAGKNGYYIHHAPSDYKISRWDMCIIDCGATANGYCADVTRTFYSGSDSKQAQIYSWLLEVSQKVVDKIEAGLEFSELQEIYKKEMVKRRCSVMHYIGHSVGMEVHEPLETLQPGSVITVEPGIYIKGFGGARVEDMVLVKKSGAEVLTKRIKR